MRRMVILNETEYQVLQQVVQQITSSIEVRRVIASEWMADHQKNAKSEQDPFKAYVRGCMTEGLLILATEERVERLPGILDTAIQYNYYLPIVLDTGDYSADHIARDILLVNDQSSLIDLCLSVMTYIFYVPDDIRVMPQMSGPQDVLRNILLKLYAAVVDRTATCQSATTDETG